MSENVKVVANNRKASFEYFLFEHFEAGLALKGSEIKSDPRRADQPGESYIRVDENQAG